MRLLGFSFAIALRIQQLLVIEIHKSLERRQVICFALFCFFRRSICFEQLISNLLYISDFFHEMSLGRLFLYAISVNIYRYSVSIVEH